VNTPPSVTIKLFASLAETCGWRERQRALAGEMCILDLWRAETGQTELPSRVLCARNMEYCDASTVVGPGDEIAFFPPVTGGSHAG
jgi:molybdopterin synthase sulfur carrier subunit